MPDRIVPAIEHILRDMGVDIVEERVTYFLIQEIQNGKSLEDALKEPYVVNNTRPAWRRHVLENPRLVNAIEQEIDRSFKSREGE